MPPSQLSTAAKDENGEIAKRIAQLERETERQDSRISGQALTFNNALVKLDNRMMCDKHSVCDCSVRSRYYLTTCTILFHQAVA